MGVLTEALAARCDRLLGVDVAEAALTQARDRTAGLEHVAVEQMTVPGGWPEATFDLVVLSEVAYYLGPADFRLLRQRCASTVEEGGHLVLVHWTGETDYPLTGDAVHDAFLADPAWDRGRAERAGSYRLDVLTRHRSP